MIISGVTLANVGYVVDNPLVTDGLVYNIDIASGSYTGTSSLTDLASSGLGATTLYNSPTYNSANGGYYTFNGSNQYAYTPNLVSKFNSPSNSNLTLEMWVNIPSDNGCLLVEEGSPSPDGGWYDSQMELVSGSLKSGVWNGITATNGTPSRSNWFQSVMTYDGNTIRTYLNTVAGTTNTGTRQLPWANSYNYYYGIMCGTGTSLGNGSYLAGSWSVFRIYNRALSAAEVTQNYNAKRATYGL